MSEKTSATPRKPRTPKPEDKPKDAAANEPSARVAEPASESSKPKAPEAEQPKQKLGDTPVAPWQMPTPAEKAAAEPVRRR